GLLDGEQTASGGRTQFLDAEAAGGVAGLCAVDGEIGIGVDGDRASPEVELDHTAGSRVTKEVEGPVLLATPNGIQGSTRMASDLAIRLGPKSWPSGLISENSCH